MDEGQRQRRLGVTGQGVVVVNQEPMPDAMRSYLGGQ